MNTVRCDCYGCWFSGKQGFCGCFECSECEETGATPIPTNDIKSDGSAYRPCTACRGGAR